MKKNNHVLKRVGDTLVLQEKITLGNVRNEEMIEVLKNAEALVIPVKKGGNSIYKEEADKEAEALMVILGFLSVPVVKRLAKELLRATASEKEIRSICLELIHGKRGR